MVLGEYAAEALDERLAGEFNERLWLGDAFLSQSRPFTGGNYGVMHCLSLRSEV